MTPSPRWRSISADWPTGNDIHDATLRRCENRARGGDRKSAVDSARPFNWSNNRSTIAGGMTRFVNINLLRLQGSQQRIQGVLYLVEDKTRDVTLRQELIGANAAKDQFLALLSHELRNPLSPGHRDGQRTGSERPRFAGSTRRRWTSSAAMSSWKRA